MSKLSAFQSASVDDQRHTRTQGGSKVANGWEAMDADRGGVLLRMLMKRQAELGHTSKELADALGVTYGYVSQLKNGMRQTFNISEDTAAACAVYLGMPKISVLMAAGRVRPEDFYENPVELAQTLPRAFSFVQSDPKWSHLITEEIEKLSETGKYLIVSMYEEATGRSLLPQPHSLIQLAQQIELLQKQHTEMKMRHAQRQELIEERADQTED